MIISKNLERLVKGKSDVILMDLSWHLHRNYHAVHTSQEINGYSRPTGHIYGILSTLMSIREGYPNSLIIICKDGIPVDRQELQANREGSGYKEGRPELEFDFYKDVPLIESACYLLNNTVFAFNEDKESDDLMYALSKQIELISASNIYIYSGDDDLLQSITDQTKVVRAMDYKNHRFEEIDNRVLATDEKFYKKYRGVDSEHIPFYRAIVGDKSDKIEGIPRFPRELAKRIAMGCELVEDIFNVVPNSSTEKKYTDILCSEKDKIIQNYSLMKLDSEFNVNLIRRKVKREVVVSQLKGLGMNRFLSYIGG